LFVVCHYLLNNLAIEFFSKTTKTSIKVYVIDLHSFFRIIGNRLVEFVCKIPAESEYNGLTSTTIPFANIGSTV